MHFSFRRCSPAASAGTGWCLSEATTAGVCRVNSFSAGSTGFDLSGVAWKHFDLVLVAVNARTGRLKKKDKSAPLRDKKDKDEPQPYLYAFVDGELKLLALKTGRRCGSAHMSKNPCHRPSQKNILKLWDKCAGSASVRELFGSELRGVLVKRPLNRERAAVTGFSHLYLFGTGLSPRHPQKMSRRLIKWSLQKLQEFSAPWVLSLSS